MYAANSLCTYLVLSFIPSILYLASRLLPFQSTCTPALCISQHWPGQDLAIRLRSFFHTFVSILFSSVCHEPGTHRVFPNMETFTTSPQQGWQYSVTGLPSARCAAPGRFPSCCVLPS